MTSDRPITEPSDDAGVLHAAASLQARGIKPIPVPHREKGPRIKNWQKGSAQDVAVCELFADRSGNVGIQCGAVSGNLLAVDLDCQEAAELAFAFLPKTLADGRQSKRPSHLFYRVEGELKSRRYAMRKSSLLVEVRGEGTQTLVPPSTHPSGEAMHWLFEMEPAELTRDELDRRVGGLASACAISRAWPMPGVREEFALALAGFLITSGLSSEESQHVIAGAARAARDEESEKRGACAASTARRFENHEPITGESELARLLGRDAEELLTLLRQWLLLHPSTDPRRAKARTQVGSERERLFNLGTECDRFVDSRGEAYARLPSGTHRIRSEECRHWLTSAFVQRYQKPPSSGAVRDAILGLAACTAEGNERRDTAVRVGRSGATSYLDLAVPEGTVVAFEDGRWSLLPRASIEFLRPTGMLALPLPDQSPDLDALHAFVNVADDGDYRLLVAALTYSLVEQANYPIILLTGEQGSAKTTAARVCRSLVDPHQVGVTRLPDDTRDLFLQANHTYVLSFDNVSRLKADQSDALCVIATGGTYATRRLYTDADEVLFTAKNPVLLNGIEDFAQRADLLDRCIPLRFEAIDPSRRRREREFWADFETKRPRIFSGLVELAAAAHLGADVTTTAGLTRMADFQQWGNAIERAAGWNDGCFEDALFRALGRGTTVALESSVMAAPLLQLLQHQAGFHGTATQLLADLVVWRPEPVPRGWPILANQLSNQLRRLAPGLRERGWHVEWRREGSDSQRVISISSSDGEEKGDARHQDRPTS